MSVLDLIKHHLVTLLLAAGDIFIQHGYEAYVVGCILRIKRSEPGPHGLRLTYKSRYTEISQS